MNRLSLFSIGLYLLLAVGFFTLNGTLVSLAIPLAVYLMAALLQSPEALKLEATRRLSATCAGQEMPVEVTLEIRNLGGHLDEIEVHDDLPGGLQLVAGETGVRTRLANGERVTLQYTIKARRGRYAFHTVRATAVETSGLFRRVSLLRVPGELLVLPKVTRLRHVAIRPLQTRGSVGPIPARVGGAGVDFFRVREYRQGDPRRRINWRLSARNTRTLLTNEFEQERVADVGVILDARRRSAVRMNGESLFEHSVGAAAALADLFLNDGNRVALLVYGKGPDWIFPGYGKTQRGAILRGLARAEIGDSQVFENLDYLPTRLFAAKSQLVLLSPLCEEDPQMLTRLRSRGYRVLVVSPDPVRFEARMLGDGGLDEQSIRIARLERIFLLRKLRSAGIPVVDWDVAQRLDATIYAAIGRRPLWFRAVEGAP